MSAATDNRRTDLAKIHIARKDLALDEDVYRQIVRDVGGAASGSSADLGVLGRARVLQHFRQVGWKPKHKPMPKRRSPDGVALASHAQVQRIRDLWIAIADAGGVQMRDPQALRAWLRSQTRARHPYRAGWSAPEFLPLAEAQRVIEQLKSWLSRLTKATHVQS
jgi:phage gp16-like protein